VLNLHNCEARSNAAIHLRVADIRWIASRRSQ
jgi:hypothetical protein